MNSESILSNEIAAGGYLADYWRSPGAVFVRLDFVGSKREMSPNRAAGFFRQERSVQVVISVYGSRCAGNCSLKARGFIL